MPSNAWGLSAWKAPLKGRQAAFIFDLGLTTFTIGMAKRLSPGPFETAPIVQGNLDGTGTPDIVTFPRGDPLGNVVSPFYSNFDQFQGTAVKWWTAETASADRTTGFAYIWFVSASYWARYSYVDARFEFRAGAITHIHPQALVTGTLYFVSFSYDTKNTIDAVSSIRSGINAGFGISGSGLVASAPGATIALGSDGAASPAQAIIEGLTIYRRVLYDGTYGVEAGNGNELEQIYAAGAGVDSTSVTGSWGVTTCIPTDSAAGALVTGAGNAWSHPHASSIPDDTFMARGGYLGGPYSVQYDGADTITTVADNAIIQDLHDAAMNVDVWVRADGPGEGGFGVLIEKRATDAGWSFFYQSGGVNSLEVLIGANTTNALSRVDFVPDGKYHLATFFFDDAGDRKIYIGIDGIWAATYVLQNAAVGVITSDVGHNLVMGARIGGTLAMDGAEGWIEISDNDRHNHGTDFVRPLVPFDDINTTELWLADEGTGATLAAQVNSPANDGTITSGSWSPEWDQAGTPVVPQALQFHQENDGIDFASGAAIDNLFSADCTIESWFCCSSSTDISYLVTKADSIVSRGFAVWITAAGTVRVVAAHATNNLSLTSTFPVNDGVAHHIAVDFDFGTLTGRLLIDGIEDDTDVAVGAYQSDAADDCIVNGLVAVGTLDNSFTTGWIRLSDNRRYTTRNAVIPGRTDPPGNDANAQLLINMDDGAGTTATDSSGNGFDGTITFGPNTTWETTIDMETIEPGARVYQWGYVVGSDGVDDGLVGTFPVTAETDHAVRAVVSTGQSGRGFPQIYVFDNIGAVQIDADYNLPRFTGAHTGGNGSATLVCATGFFRQQQVGWTAYNTTDGCEGVITAISGDFTTCTFGGGLSGGTDDDFDTGDTYILRPPNGDAYARHPNATESIFVFRTPVGCTSINIELRNAAGEGMLQWHQCEVQESLIDNGGMETGAGNPFIPDGWNNEGLDAGESQASSGGGGIIHSGLDALEYNNAGPGEGIRQRTTRTVGGFAMMGGWFYNRSVFSGWDTSHQVLQSNPSSTSLTAPVTDFWTLLQGVWRSVLTTPRTYIAATNRPALYVDDVFCVALDPITLTVTPSNLANSTENGGRRVDGFDQLTQPEDVLRPNSGDIRWPSTPRQGDSETVLFGNPTPYGMTVFGDANNFIAVFWNAADTLRLAFNANGAGLQTADWATGGAFFIPGTLHQYRVRYWSNRMILYVDGLPRATINQPTGFIWPAGTLFYAGTDENGENQIDEVFG